MVKEARIVDMDTTYGITVVNTSDIDMFVYVFYFDPVDYSIRVSKIDYCPSAHRTNSRITIGLL